MPEVPNGDDGNLEKGEVVPPKQVFGKLHEGEPHPSAYIAMKWLTQQDPKRVAGWHAAFHSLSQDGTNRIAEVCAETLRRISEGEPISDRYILGLVYAMRFDDEPVQKVEP